MINTYLKMGFAYNYFVLGDFLAYLRGFYEQQSAFFNVVSLLFLLFYEFFESIFVVQNNKLFVVL